MLAGGGSVRNSPLGTALQRQPRIVSSREQQLNGTSLGSSAAWACCCKAVHQPLQLCSPHALSLGIIYATVRRTRHADNPLSPTLVQRRVTDLARTQHDHAGCLGLVRSTLATDFLLGLTCLQNRSPHSEEQILPLPSPHSYVMIRCCPNTHTHCDLF